eukprot:10821465-Karenia_brevis.AAC.1
MMLGNRQKVRSLVQKYYCEKRNAMLMTDGQWFLFERANGNQVWICAVCGGNFPASSRPFCVGMKTGPLPQDVVI